MKSLVLQSSIPTGSLGRWLSDTELDTLRRIVSVNTSVVRVSRVSKEDSNIGVVKVATSVGWKKLDISAKYAGRKNPSVSQYDIVYNDYVSQISDNNVVVGLDTMLTKRRGPDYE